MLRNIENKTEYAMQDGNLGHCLDRELAEGMEESVFVELLKQMEAVGERWS